MTCLLYEHCYIDMMIICCVFLQDGSNAMHLAAMMGHERLVDLILQKHPDMIKQTDNVSEHNTHFIT